MGIIICHAANYWTIGIEYSEVMHDVTFWFGHHGIQISRKSGKVYSKRVDN